MVFRKPFSTLALGLMVGSIVWPASGRAMAGEPVRKITVTAKADIDVVPDEVLLKLRVVSKNKDLSKAKAENDAITKAVLALAAKHGIPDRQFTMTNLDMGPDYEQRGRDREYVFVGYVVRRTIEISIRDFAKMEPVLSDAIRAGVTQADDLLFRTREPRKHYAEVREKAVRYAQDKAAQLAELNGLRLGQALEIQDEPEDNEHTWGYAACVSSASNRTPGPARFQLVGDQKTEPAAGLASEKAKSGAPKKTPAEPNLLAPGTITLSAKITIVFEMLPEAR